MQTINKTIKFLIFSDFFLLFSIGLLSPILAVFVLDHVENSMEVVGYAVACYWVARVFMVIPFSWLMDRTKGELDEYSFMVLGTFFIAFIPLLYMVASEPWHLYLIQIFNGFANAMAVPAWRVLFTNHIDKDFIGFEWSLEDVGIGIATAASAAFGAIIADRFGFTMLFGIMSFFALMSSLILFLLGRSEKFNFRDLIRNRQNRAPFKLDSMK